MKKAPKSGLTTKHWFGYMFGDWGGCMTFTLMAGTFNLYCTHVLKVNPILLGTLLLIWTIWDAVNDPMMGTLMDKIFAKKQNKNGKFRPWLLRATPLLAITAIALWTVPTFFVDQNSTDATIATLVALFSCKILYEAAYTMFNIPMGSLLSAMSTNDSERASLSSARGVGSMIGNMIPGMAGPAIIGMFGERSSTGFMITGVVCAVIGFGVCLMHYFWTEERTIVADAKADDIHFSDILTVVRKNRPFVALCIHGICICTMQYLVSNISLYMYSDVYHDVTYQSIASALSAPFMIGSMIAVPFLCKKLGLEKLIRYSLLVGGGICLALFGLHVVMDVPPLVHGVILGIGSGMSMVSIQMQWGLVGEAIDYNEYITGKRTEGSIYGTFNLSRRIGNAIGNSSGLFALGLIGFDAAKEVQSAGTIFGLKALCVLVPAVFIMGSWVAFKFVWNITPEVRAEMAAKKAADAQKAAK